MRNCVPYTVEELRSVHRRRDEDAHHHGKRVEVHRSWVPPLGEATRKDIEYRRRLLTFYGSVLQAVGLGDELLSWLMDENRVPVAQELPDTLRLAVTRVLDPLREASWNVTGAGY